jgi:hypothetical protein
MSPHPYLHFTPPLKANLIWGALIHHISDRSGSSSETQSEQHLHVFTLLLPALIGNCLPRPTFLLLLLTLAPHSQGRSLGSSPHLSSSKDLNLIPTPLKKMIPMVQRHSGAPLTSPTKKSLTKKPMVTSRPMRLSIGPDQTICSLPRHHWQLPHREMSMDHLPLTPCPRR